MDLPLVTATVHGEGVEIDLPAAIVGPWRVWVWGQPEGWARLFAEHRLGEPPATGGPALALAHLVDRVGLDRALPQLEGVFAALLTNGADTWAVADRIGQHRWWWRQTREGVALSTHPSGLPDRGALDWDRLRAWGFQSPDAPPPWPSVARVDAGTVQRFTGGAPAGSTVWWSVARPPAGRAGSRIIWDRSLDQALTLGISRATRDEGWVHLRGGDGDSLLDRAATSPATAQDPAPPGAVLAALGPLPEPGLSATARQVAGAVLHAPQHSAAVALAGGNLALAGLARRRDTGDAWQRAVARGLAQHTSGPLTALAQQRGARLALPLVHPVVLGNAARVPWRHLRGLRQSAARRLGLPRPVDPWQAWLRGPGRAVVAEVSRSAEGRALGPADEAHTASWLVVARWAAAQAP